MSSAEIKPIVEAPQPPVEIGEGPKETPAPVERQIQPSPGPFQAQPAPAPQPAAVSDDNTNVVSITVPATPQQLEDWAKGSPDNSLTWMAFYWIRMIKKALMHGYRVMTTAQPAV